MGCISRSQPGCVSESSVWLKKIIMIRLGHPRRPGAHLGGRPFAVRVSGRLPVRTPSGLVRNSQPRFVAASAVNPAPPVSVRRAPWSRAQVRKDREAGGSPLGRPASRRVVPHLACPSRTSRQSSVIRLHVPSLPCRGCSGPILQRGRRAPEGSLTDSCSESVFSHWPHPSVCPPRPQPCSHCWGSSGGGAVVT